MHSGARKETLRAELLTARKALTAEARAAESNAIHTHIMAHDMWQSAHTVVGYIATDDEVATLPLLHEAHRAGKIIVVPRMSESLMCWHIVEDITNDTLLVRSKYGIYEPTESAPPWVYNKKDARGVLWLIPGVGFDTHGNRLGRGGGHYDRALSKASHALHTVGVAFRVQIRAEIPHEKNDIKMTRLVTPDGWVECK